MYFMCSGDSNGNGGGRSYENEKLLFLTQTISFYSVCYDCLIYFCVRFVLYNFAFLLMCDNFLSLCWCGLRYNGIFFFVLSIIYVLAVAATATIDSTPHAHKHRQARLYNDTNYFSFRFCLEIFCLLFWLVIFVVDSVTFAEYIYIFEFGWAKW